MNCQPQSAFPIRQMPRSSASSTGFPSLGYNPFDWHLVKHVQRFVTDFSFELRFSEKHLREFIIGVLQIRGSTQPAVALSKMLGVL
jgi:hypothetical protein